MIAELGHLAVIIAFMVAIVQSVVPMIGASKGYIGWMDAARPSAIIQFLLIFFAFIMLTISFVTSDFSVKLVASNSHSLKPLLYKISGVWGNHEGSMLLWILILAFYGALGLDKVSGALVSGVPEGPGADAGIQSGDVITSFDGVEVEDTRGLVTAVGNADVGKVVRVIIFRDGKTKTIKVTLGRREAAEKEKLVPVTKAPEKIKETEKFGMKLLTINSESRIKLNLPEDLEGVAVLDVSETSDAFEKGIRAGDVIVEAGRTKIADVNDISKIFEDAIEAGRKSILLLVLKGDNSRFVGLSLSEK